MTDKNRIEAIIAYGHAGHWWVQVQPALRAVGAVIALDGGRYQLRMDPEPYRVRHHAEYGQWSAISDHDSWEAVCEAANAAVQP